MKFKKINAWLHLWLGLISGIVVLIVSITGCIYVFQDEIRGLYEPWKFVTKENRAYLPPSALAMKAKPYLNTKKITGITYAQPGQAATVASVDRKKGLFFTVTINPYSGEVLKVKKLSREDKKSDFDFFRFILNGHRTLWLPHKIGGTVVGVGVLMFTFILISGLIMWWPKNLKKSNFNKSFKIKWGASFKRLNYDFHNVFGFYSMLVLLIIACTGLVWSFQWFGKSVYWITSAGKSLPPRMNIHSDTTSLQKFQLGSVDRIYTELSRTKNEGIFLSVPSKKTDVVGATVYLRAGTYYKADYYTYDQFSLKPLKNTGPFGGKYADADIGDKIRRMNFDIHVGSILGIPGKIIAFLVSLISASLPITGFIIWWGKGKKKKPTPKKVSTQI